MKNTCLKRASTITWILIAAAGVMMVGCSLVGGKTPVVIRPYEGAPVTAAVDGRTLIVANNMTKRIYLRVFPTDILAVIEWAPCIAPETCPDNQAIDPGGEKNIKVGDIARDETESITVYWWRYLEKAPGASVPPMEMDEIVVFIP